MPGLFENDDPGVSGLVGFHVTSTSSTGRSFPVLNVDRVVDRLSFTGLDQDLVAEADRRLRADSRAGMRWLQERLEAFAPPRKPPSCDCGESLVDLAWRGRATVRCSVCGSRWGVEVLDEGTESLWAISGPSAEWLEAYPVDDDPYGDFQPEDVLRDGLPAVPVAAIEPGTCLPVAMWQDDRHAAVLYVHRLKPAEFDLPGEEYEDETEHLVLDEAGGWRCTGSGGGTWVDVFDPPVGLLDRYVVLGTGISGTSDGAETVSCIGGLCSSAVAALETIDGYGTRRYRVDQERPFFVVGVRGPGRVRILDQDGHVLHGRTGAPLEFALHDHSP